MSLSSGDVVGIGLVVLLGGFELWMFHRYPTLWRGMKRHWHPSAVLRRLEDRLKELDRR